MSENLGLLALTLNGILAGNVILSRALGLGPFLGASRRLDTAAFMGVMTTAVMVAAAGISWLADQLLVRVFEDAAFLRPMVFALIAAILVQVVEILTRRFATVTLRQIRPQLPILAADCAVLAILLENTSLTCDLLTALIAALACGVGYFAAIVLFAGLQTRLAEAECPRSWQGMPITLTALAILMLSVMGISGMRF